MSSAVHVLDLPLHEARALLASTDAPVFLGVNPVEFHGPHLSLHNDRHITAGLSRDLHRAIAARRPGLPFLVVDDLELGVEPTSGPGSRHARYADARRAVVEACRALVELGARRAVLNTFHGAALHNLALDAGVQVFEAAGRRAFAPLHVALERMIELDASELEEALEHVSAQDRARVAQSLRFDFHAGWIETSLALHYAPDSVSDLHRALPPAPPLGLDRGLALAARAARRLGGGKVATELDFVARAATWSKQRPFCGYTGFPHLASAQAGAAIARAFVARYAEGAEAVLERGAPAPRAPFGWMPWLTLGGRLEGTFVPTEHVSAEPPAHSRGSLGTARPPGTAAR